MAKNVIALIFPEYNDKGNLVTSSDWTTDELYDDKSIGKQLKDAGTFVDFFRDEDCQLIYDPNNIRAFWFVVDTLPECYPSRAKELITILKGLEDWRKHRISSETDEYHIHYKVVTDEIRTEIASRQETSPVDSFIIATNVFGKENNCWELKKEGTSATIESVPMHIPNVFDWLSKHHNPLREYEWNEKHGEYGKGAHRDNKGDEVSVLLCSREHAAELLPIAIGEPKYDMLHCYDPEHNKYMEYKAGCKFANLQPGAKERTYHSYHINNEGDVPQRVVYKIKLLQKLSEQ